MAWDGQRVLQEMADKMKVAVGEMAARVAQMMPEERRYLLTPEEQLRRFLNHTPESLEYIRRQRGDADFLRYVRSMVKIAKYLQGGG